MKIKPIGNDKDLQEALARANQIWEAKQGTPEGDELDALVDLVEAYEAEHCPIDPPDSTIELEGSDAK